MKASEIEALLINKGFQFYHCSRVGSLYYKLDDVVVRISNHEAPARYHNVKVVNWFKDRDGIYDRRLERKIDYVLSQYRRHQSGISLKSALIKSGIVENSA